MGKIRVGRRICVHGVLFDSSWFCPYCCATVDTYLETGALAVPPDSLGQSGVRDTVLRPQGASGTAFPVLEVRRLVRRASLVWPYKLTAFAAPKVRVRLALPSGFVSQVQCFIDTDNLSIEFAVRSFRHRCLLSSHPLPPPNLSLHRGDLIGPVARSRGEPRNGGYPRTLRCSVSGSLQSGPCRGGARGA